jgi:hypothetical protein
MYRIIKEENKKLDIKTSQIIVDHISEHEMFLAVISARGQRINIY